MLSALYSFCLLEVFEDLMVLLLLAPLGRSSTLSIGLLVTEDRAHFVARFIFNLVQFL